MRIPGPLYSKVVYSRLCIISAISLPWLIKPSGRVLGRWMPYDSWLGVGGSPILERVCMLSFVWARTAVLPAVCGPVWTWALVAAEAAGTPLVPPIASCLHVGMPQSLHRPSSQSFLFLSLSSAGLVLPLSWSLR